MSAGWISTAILALSSSFLLAVVTGPFLIRRLKELKYGQVIREEGPQAHQAKSGTPSMGGVMIFLPVFLLATGLGFARPEIWLLLGLCLSYAGLGFLDDWLIVKKRSNKGLSARQKFAGQLLLAALFGLGLWMLGWRTEVRLPSFIPGGVVELGWLYWPWIVLVVAGSANAVNLTDGLDGLAASTFSCAAAGLAALLWATQGPGTATLHGETVLLLALLVGGCLGFLWFNAHPAGVFMGDTGSLGLGAALAGAAILGHLELALLLCGGVFVVETLSVVAQVLYFKWTKGKRLLKMSPLHHHFELSGWKETQVVARFSLVGVLCSVWAFWVFHQ